MEGGRAGKKGQWAPVEPCGAQGCMEYAGARTQWEGEGPRGGPRWEAPQEQAGSEASRRAAQTSREEVGGGNGQPACGEAGQRTVEAAVGRSDSAMASEDGRAEGARDR